MEKVVCIVVENGSGESFIEVLERGRISPQHPTGLHGIDFETHELLCEYPTAYPDESVRKIQQLLNPYRISEDRYLIPSSEISMTVMEIDECLSEFEDENYMEFHVKRDRLREGLESTKHRLDLIDEDSKSDSSDLDEMSENEKSDDRYSQLYERSDQTQRLNLVYLCNRCQKRFKLKGDVLRHLSRKTPCKIFAAFSGAGGTTKAAFLAATDSMEFHVKPCKKSKKSRLHGVSAAKPCKSSTCPVCHKTYSRPDSLRRHLRNSKCSEMMSGKNYMEFHVKKKTPCKKNSTENCTGAGAGPVQNAAFSTESKEDGQKLLGKNGPQNPHAAAKAATFHGTGVSHQLAGPLHRVSRQLAGQKKNARVGAKYECEDCGKGFTRPSSLSRHYKFRCGEKKIESENHDEKWALERAEKESLFQRLLQQMEAQQKEIRELKDEIRETRGATHQSQTNIKEMNNTSNVDYSTDNTKMNSENTINIQNNNNIKLLAFGQEDLSHITDEVCQKLLKLGFTAVPSLIGKIHYEDDKPANHNVFISNMQNKYAMIFDGDDWKITDRNLVINQLYEDKREILETKFEEMESQLPEPAKRRFHRFLETDDESMEVKNIKQDIKEIMYNSRKIPQKTMRRLGMDKKKLQ